MKDEESCGESNTKNVMRRYVWGTLTKILRKNGGKSRKNEKLYQKMWKLFRKVIKSEEIHRGKTYIFANFPHFLITFLAALPPCHHCFHRTDLLLLLLLLDIIHLRLGYSGPVDTRPVIHWEFTGQKSIFSKQNRLPTRPPPGDSCITDIWPIIYYHVFAS